jgi:hypothetical protein
VCEGLYLNNLNIRELTFNEAVNHLRNGEQLYLRSCSLCNSGLHFVIHDNKLCFQAHCNCVTYEAFRPTSIDNLKSFCKKDN